MGKRPPRFRESPIAIRLDVTDEDLRARLLALLGADERYSVRWHAAGGLGDAEIVIADRAVTSSGAVILLIDDPSKARGKAVAVLPADADGEVLEAAITLVMSGLAVGPAGPTRETWHEAPSESADGPGTARAELASEGAPLTTREHEVLVLLAEGASNKMIANRLGISVHTAKFHVGSVLGKLGARSRSDAIAIGLRRGLLLL